MKFRGYVWDGRNAYIPIRISGIGFRPLLHVKQTTDYTARRSVIHVRVAKMRQ